MANTKIKKTAIPDIPADTANNTYHICEFVELTSAPASGSIPADCGLIGIYGKYLYISGHFGSNNSLAWARIAYTN